MKMGRIDRFGTRRSRSPAKQETVRQLVLLSPFVILVRTQLTGTWNCCPAWAENTHRNVFWVVPRVAIFIGPAKRGALLCPKWGETIWQGLDAI
jgi:hypothetical protein